MRHTLVCSSLLLVCGYQAVLFALLAKTFAVAEGFLPEDKRLTRFYAAVNLERGIMGALVALVVGVGLIGWALNRWRVAEFGT